MLIRSYQTGQIEFVLTIVLCVDLILESLLGTTKFIEL